MRGRAIALWQVAFQGTTPIGGPAIGWIIAETNPRLGLAIGGVSCLAAAAGGGLLAWRLRRAAPATDPAMLSTAPSTSPVSAS
jgi:MFS family permease